MTQQNEGQPETVQDQGSSVKQIVPDNSGALHGEEAFVGKAGQARDINDLVDFDKDTGLAIPKAVEPEFRMPSSPPERPPVNPTPAKTEDASAGEDSGDNTETPSQ